MRAFADVLFPVLSLAHTMDATIKHNGLIELLLRCAGGLDEGSSKGPGRSLAQKLDATGLPLGSVYGVGGEVIVPGPALERVGNRESCSSLVLLRSRQGMQRS